MRARRAAPGDAHAERAAAARTAIVARLQRPNADGARGTVSRYDRITRREQSMRTLAPLAATGRDVSATPAPNAPAAARTLRDDAPAHRLDTRRHDPDATVLFTL